jgi:hypothetical protein
VYLVSNRSTLSWDAPAATRVGPLVVTTRDLALASAWDDRIALAPRGAGASGSVQNVSPEPHEVHLRVAGVDQGARMLAPAATWQIEVP